MTPEHRLAVIVETIRAIQIGTPVSKGRVTILLQPWPDLYWNAMEREGAGWINLLQAAAAAGSSTDLTQAQWLKLTLTPWGNVHCRNTPQPSCANLDPSTKRRAGSLLWYTKYGIQSLT
jgi:hypothetical protein